MHVFRAESEIIGCFQLLILHWALTGPYQNIEILKEKLVYFGSGCTFKVIVLLKVNSVSLWGRCKKSQSILSISFLRALSSASLMMTFWIASCPVSRTTTPFCFSTLTLVRRAHPHVWIVSKLSQRESWQPLLTDDVDEVAKLAHRVREKTSNIHAAYHQTDGGTTAQQVPVYF